MSDRTLTLEKLICTTTGLDQKHYLVLKKFLKRKELVRREQLIGEGEICSFIGFIGSGVFRSYILKDGNEFNVDFYVPGSVISSYTSFLTAGPSVGFIQALSAAEIYSLTKADYDHLLQEDPAFLRMAKQISDSLFIKKCRRESSLLMDSAAERYAFLLKLYPSLEQMVPQYHIASYLGIKPESLSRLKSLTYINGKKQVGN